MHILVICQINYLSPFNKFLSTFVLCSFRMVKAEEENNEKDVKEEPTPPEEKKSQDESSSEPEFVLVKDLVTGEVMELPTQSPDNTLGLTTLTHAFPGAYGLKYKTESGVTRALL